MTPAELISATSPTVGSLGGSFYFEPATLAHGKDMGLDGFRFYFLGRGGVLGDVEAPVVTSAFGYFEPALIARMWTSAKEIVPPREAGTAYVEACREHGRAHLGEVDGLEEFSRQPAPWWPHSIRPAWRCSPVGRPSPCPTTLRARPCS